MWSELHLVFLCKKCLSPPEPPGVGTYFLGIFFCEYDLPDQIATDCTDTVVIAEWGCRAAHILRWFSWPQGFVIYGFSPSMSLIRIFSPEKCVQEI